MWCTGALAFISERLREMFGGRAQHYKYPMSVCAQMHIVHIVRIVRVTSRTLCGWFFATARRC